MVSRINLDATTLAGDLRDMAGDGSIDWVNQPIQASVLLDVADMLDENAELREERDTYRDLVGCMVHPDIADQLKAENDKLRELVREQDRLTEAVRAYWSGGKTFEQFGNVFKAVLRVTLLAGELGIKED